MIRQGISFTCEGARLIGTLDLPDAAPTAALLIVSGGREIRSGAWGGQSWMAAEMARAGYAVLRFDRRGVGDSEGEDGGYRSAGPDIAAAMAALRAAVPGLARVVALGNCDAASALMLAGGAGADALVLSNPWTLQDEERDIESDIASDNGTDIAPEPKMGPKMSKAALLAHYRARLTNPAALKSLFSGKVSPLALLGSVVAMVRPGRPAPNALAQAMAQGLAGFGGPVRLLLARRDRTALAFAESWNAKDKRVAWCQGASHSFVEPTARDWYRAQVLAALAEEYP
jgi:pimeloyl-ACP methyl ester carboxylesterase